MVHSTLTVECQNAWWKRVAGRTAGSLRCINWQTTSWGFVTIATAGSTYNNDLTHLAAFLDNNTRRNDGLRIWESRLMSESLPWKTRCTQLHTWDGVAQSTLANTSKYYYEIAQVQTTSFCNCHDIFWSYGLLRYRSPAPLRSHLPKNFKSME